MNTETNLLKIQDLMSRLACSRQTIRRWRRLGDFPAPLLLKGRIPRWSTESLEKWISKQTEGTFQLNQSLPKKSTEQ